jgi:hypothetical protein
MFDIDEFVSTKPLTLSDQERREIELFCGLIGARATCPAPVVHLLVPTVSVAALHLVLLAGLSAIERGRAMLNDT